MHAKDQIEHSHQVFKEPNSQFFIHFFTVVVIFINTTKATSGFKFDFLQVFKQHGYTYSGKQSQVSK